MNPSAAFRWQAICPEGLLWAQWESDTSLFQGATGDTHLLSALPAEALRQLAKSSMTQTELVERLAAACHIDASPEWAEKIANILRDLANLELIEPTIP